MRFLRWLAPALVMAVALAAYADAPESTSQIQNDLRDGQPTGSITPQVIRNFAVSMFNPYPAQVSAAGANQAGATQLTSMFNVITSCTSGQGVIATTYYTKIWNATANACNVYPPSGAQFDSHGTNTAVYIAAGASAEFIMTSSTQGYAR